MKPFPYASLICASKETFLNNQNMYFMQGVTKLYCLNTVESLCVLREEDGMCLVLSCLFMLSQHRCNGLVFIDIAALCLH
jgi:hypothetical protein